MKRLLALVLLCLSLLLALPASAQMTPHKSDAPNADDIARRVNEAVAQGGNAEEVAERIRGALAGTGYRLQRVDGNVDPGSGSERILSYDIDVRINADSTLDVTETIRVVAQGIQIRRGLYRDFPTRYADRYGNSVVVGFDVIGLQRDGKPEPWFTESLSNGVRVNFGNDDFLTVPAIYTYTLRYRTNRQLGFFKDHDELYWNAIGTGWDFSIERASVTVHLPQPVPVANLRAEGYTGPQGAKGQEFIATLPAPGVAHWQTTAPLYPQHGLTIVLSFPKGLVRPPTPLESAGWVLRDNRAVLVGLGTFLTIFLYLFIRWFQVGRDPAPGVEVVRYEPPAGYSPAALRFIWKTRNDAQGITADLVALATRGLLRISRQDKALAADQWSIVQADTHVDGSLPPSQRALFNALFQRTSAVQVSGENRETFMIAKAAQSKVLEDAYNERMFRRNNGPIGRSLLLAIVGLGLAFYLHDRPGDIALLMAATMLTLISIIAFTPLLVAPTAEGRKLLDEIAGLKRYLTVAERDDLSRLTGPDPAPTLDARRYQDLLPFAMALDVEAAWTAKFTAAVGTAAARQAIANMGWYSGAPLATLDDFSSALGQGFGSQIASASTPPGSSSGGGGGGFSGGGGGGGGGGR